MIAAAPQGAYPRNDNATGKGGAGGFTEQTSHNINGSAPGKKWETILRHLLDVGSLNRFEAEPLHDHCLHSTVSGLRRSHGIEFDRKFETVPCLKGRATTKVKRYWIAPTPDNLKRAREALGQCGEVPQ